jgi:hypothetical protein
MEIHRCNIDDVYDFLVARNSLRLNYHADLFRGLTGPAELRSIDGADAFTSNTCESHRFTPSTEHLDSLLQ